MPRKLPDGGKKSTHKFNPKEAITAIGFVTIIADGSVEEAEAETLVELLKAIDLFKEVSQEEFTDLIKEITKICKEEGPAALLNSSVDALSSKNHKEAALMVAFLICSSDGEVADEEEEYLNALQKLLGISDERYDEILEELYGKDK